ALHGDGVRMEQADRWRSIFHVIASCVERRDYDFCICAARWLVAWNFFDHSALGDATDFSGSLYRRAGHSVATLAAYAYAKGRERIQYRHAKDWAVVDFGFTRNSHFAIRVSR